MSSPPTILLIAPDPSDRTRLATMLEDYGHPVVQAGSGTQARAAMPPAGTDLVILLDLAGGSEALRYLRGPASTRAHAPVVCLADRRQISSSSEALRLGVADLVGRPVREEDLRAAIANARELARTPWGAAGTTAESDVPPGAVFGASPAMREVLALIRRVAASRCAVLLTGERGTGRELIARALHAQGINPSAPFIKIPCADLVGDELTTLFTGATPPGATVYLENVHELPPSQQRRLGTHIREEGSGPREPSGDPAVRPAARFIGAAPARVLDPATRNQVRRELLDALGVVRIDVPPLRQRTEDIPLLAAHFLKETCRRHDIPPKSFSRSALMMLASLPWSGNAQELRSLTERLVVLVPRGTVLLEDVLTNVRFDGAEAMGRARGTLREARDGFERDYIVAVLQHHHGRMGAAARELGIERTNLYRKIKQLNVTWTTEVG